MTTTLQARIGVTTLAVAEAARLFGLTGNQTAMFSGQTVDATAVIVKYTDAGDLNFDGLIDGADYGVMDNWFSFTGTDRYENGGFFQSFCASCAPLCGLRKRSEMWSSRG